MAYRAYINGQPSLAIDDPNLAFYAQTLGYQQENGQPLSRDELLRMLPVIDDTTGQVMHPAQQSAWQDYGPVSSITGAPAVPGLSGWSYVPMDAYQQSVAEAQAAQGPIWANGPIQLLGGLAGGALLSGLSGAAGAGGSVFGAGGELATGVGSGLGGAGAAGAATTASALPQSYWSMLADAGGAGVPSAAAGTMSAFPTTLAEIAAANEAAAAAIGETVATGTSGALGAGGLSADSLAEFLTQYQQSGAGTLSSLFNQLDAAGGGGEGGLTGIGASGALQAGAGATSLASRLLGGDASTADWLSGLGALGGPLLQYLGSQEQTKALQGVANQQWDAGSWARDLNKGSYQPGFSLYDQPGYGDALQRSADVSGRAWSAKAGNPAGSPTAQAGILNDVWQGSYLPALSNYRGGLLQAGGQGLNTSGQVGALAANNAGSGYDAAAYGVGRLTNPTMGTDWLQQLMQGMSGAGGFGNYKWDQGR